MIRSATTICLALIVSLGAADVGLAQTGGGVHVDPESPSGQEYAVPLDSARRQARGDTGDSSGGQPSQGTQTPLFGSGIGPRTKGSGARAAADGKASGRNGSSPSSGKSHAEVSRRAASITPNNGSGGLKTGGIALGVLIVGAGAGLGLRRALRPEG